MLDGAIGRVGVGPNRHNPLRTRDTTPLHVSPSQGLCVRVGSALPRATRAWGWTVNDQRRRCSIQRVAWRTRCPIEAHSLERGAARGALALTAARGNGVRQTCQALVARLV